MNLRKVKKVPKMIKDGRIQPSLQPELKTPFERELLKITVMIYKTF